MHHRHRPTGRRRRSGSSISTGRSPAWRSSGTRSSRTPRVTGRPTCSPGACSTSAPPGDGLLERRHRAGRPSAGRARAQGHRDDRAPLRLLRRRRRLVARRARSPGHRGQAPPEPQKSALGTSPFLRRPIRLLPVEHTFAYGPVAGPGGCFPGGTSDPASTLTTQPCTPGRWCSRRAGPGRARPAR